MFVMMCPLCGYAITEGEYCYIRCDPKCPRCDQYHFSDFLPNFLDENFLDKENYEGEDYE